MVETDLNYTYLSFSTLSFGINSRFLSSASLRSHPAPCTPRGALRADGRTDPGCSGEHAPARAPGEAPVRCAAAARAGRQRGEPVCCTLGQERRPWDSLRVQGERKQQNTKATIKTSPNQTNANTRFCSGETRELGSEKQLYDGDRRSCSQEPDRNTGYRVKCLRERTEPPDGRYRFSGSRTRGVKRDVPRARWTKQRSWCLVFRARAQSDSGD